MFRSYFPRPRVFFWSVLGWVVAAILVWYLAFQPLGASLGFGAPAPGQEPIGAQTFWSNSFLWFYLYYAIVAGGFYAAWQVIEPHPMSRWSILGSALIIFFTYFQVQVSVAINNWYGPFYDLIQTALSKSAPVTLPQFFGHLLSFAGIAFIAVTVAVLTRFFVNHYVFRWRASMNAYYTQHWGRLCKIEGAAQRVQEDTMRFARMLETLGVNFIDAVMTLIAFLPVLLRLSANVTELPFVGEVPYALVVVAIVWSLFGTFFLGIIGIKLPGLEFGVQKVEAAYRKELVYGEDHTDRAHPMTLGELFTKVRKTYYNYYLHYVYFNIGRFFYLQSDNIFPFIVLAPTIVAGKITLGAMNQILNAFGQVRESFQYLVRSWTDIVELTSIYQRLKGFEKVLGDDKPALLPDASPAPVGG